MGKVSKLLTEMRNNPRDVRYADLESVCRRYFGEPRTSSRSHTVFRTPWQGDPRVNIQNKNGKAKEYQVKQVLEVIDRLMGEVQYMAVDVSKYAYRVRWSEEDAEYVGTVAEFPSLSWLDETHLETFRGIVELVDEIVRDMEESGEPIPQPYALRDYSGSIRLRVPPEQHRELAIRAAEEGVSLNRLLCSLISRPVTTVVAETANVSAGASASRVEDSTWSDHATSSTASVEVPNRDLR